MSVYAVDKLMSETRRLAAEYYRTTQQTLPVSGELAKYDASRLLQLQEPNEPIAGVDLLAPGDISVQVKCRVIFNEKVRNYRIGQLNMDGAWQIALLILMNAEYQPFDIYAASRDEIIAAGKDNQSENSRKRGAMSIAKFKAIGQLIWTCQDGLEASNWLQRYAQSNH